jgi:hypothetical protein
LEAGANRFDQPGECLLGAWSEAELVGGVGLIAILTSKGVASGIFMFAGRHAYLASALRSYSDSRMKRVKPSTSYVCEAAAFYLSHGFLLVADEFASNVKSLL